MFGRRFFCITRNVGAVIVVNRVYTQNWVLSDMGMLQQLSSRRTIRSQSHRWAIRGTTDL